MYKKKFNGRRKRTFKKRRSFKKRSFKAKRIGNKMMGRGAKVVKFKQASLIRLFNPTGTPIPNPGFTLAFLNNPNAANLIQTIKPNGVGASYTQWQQVAQLYDEFTCTGVRIKYFQTPSLGGNAYVLTECFEDNNSLWNPANPDTAPLSVFGNYQTIPLNQNNSWTRFFSMARLKKNLGIGWCATSDANFTYYGQLASTTNPSFNCRNSFVGNIAGNSPYTAMEVTYYYLFRGLKSNLPQFTATGSAFPDITTLDDPHVIIEGQQRDM